MRCPLTRARICALMYPTSVPTYSKEIGTSSSITDATLTTGSGGGAAAPDLSPQPAIAAAASTTTSRFARGERTTNARVARGSFPASVIITSARIVSCIEPRVEKARQVWHHNPCQHHTTGICETKLPSSFILYFLGQRASAL